MTTLATTITPRGYRGDEDLAAIIALHERCEAADKIGDVVTEIELRESLSEPGFDSATNVGMWHDADGALVAYTEFWAPRTPEAAQSHPAAFMWYKLLPELRGQGLEEQLFAWGQARIEAAGARLGQQIQLEVVAQEAEAERRDILDRNGFSIRRYFWRMYRTLLGDLPAPALPEGVQVRAGELDAEGYVELRNAVWVDHFGYQPWSVDDVRHYREVDGYDPELDLVAYDADGRPAAFCWGHINPEEQQKLGALVGWVGLLGVRRELRGQGLGRGLLRMMLARLRAKGCEEAMLGVDGDSPTGANGLYAAEGFERRTTRIVYVR